MLRMLSQWKSVFLTISGLIIVGLLVSRHLVGPQAEKTESVGIIAAQEADKHIGARATVCGSVAEIVRVPEIEGKPTFINLHREHPDHPFTAVIWADDRLRWSTPPEAKYANQTLCIRGVIREHEGTPQIEVSAPRQIRRK